MGNPLADLDTLPLVDLSGNARIPVLMELTDALSRATSPQQVLEAIVVAMRKAYGPRCYLSLSTLGLGPGEYRVSRWLQVDGTERVAGGDPWTGMLDMPVHTGGLVGRLVATPEPKLLQNLVCKNDAVFGEAFAPFGSAIAVPVLQEGKLANWTILMHEEARGLGVADLEQLILRGNLVGTTMNNVLIANRLREATDWIRHEVDHIAQIQRALLPATNPNIPGVAVATRYETFDKAGGDYYDLIPVTVGLGGAHLERRGPWAMMIADASGHGPSAAVVVAMLHAILHARDEHINEPKQCLEFLNERLRATARRVGNSFVTAFFATYDPTTRKLVYANAGHNPPLLRLVSAGGGSIQRLDEVGGIPLGVDEKVGSDQAEMTLDPGQTLLMYTDGVTEAFDPTGRQFGESALEAVVADTRGGPDLLCENISDAVKRHRQGSKAHDDQTLVALQIRDED